MVADMTNQPLRPRCAEPDVNPEWWLEPDADHAWGGKQNGGERLDASQRARLYCYLECPLLLQCRKAGMEERYHVWGGLLPVERQTAAAKAGRKFPAVPSSEPMPHNWYRAIRLLMDGYNIVEISEQLRCRQGTVRQYISRALTAVRVEREWQEWVTASQRSAARRSSRSGRVGSPNSLTRSA